MPATKKFENFEQLGTFYLGREYDLAAGQQKEDLLLYDSKDLTTHAVVVGMTGSGKTGLCLSLLEEAGIDNIPAIVIDPKGDIANLLLTFPDLAPEDFKPWVDEGQAARENISVDEFAANQAQLWKDGLESWGQSNDRIRMLREKCEMRIYTPGSDAGRPLTILKSFAAPSPEVINDSDALRERIQSATSGLLALLGIDADPVRSREHIFISNVLDHTWRKGKDLNLGQLINHIQKPPFDKVGVMDLDTFFPSKDRMELAMTINNLLASPSFASWMSGEPLNIKSMLHTPEGKPCISILSIAHLGEKERMFFVTILLNEVLSWVRTQAGTSSLRAILYMDEVFGYFPPTKNPPSKQPMLTLLKQARAYGLGIVLATQNPVDLDYKGLANTGSWFIGRLQTERDKMRVLEGLEGASANVGSTFDRAAMEATLAGLGKRKFLLNNVHEDQPVVFETRWALSYLRGPLTRDHIKELVDKDPAAQAAIASVNDRLAGRKQNVAAESHVPDVDSRELLPADADQFFVEPLEPVRGDDRLVYRPALLGRGRLHYVRASYKVDEWVERTFLAKVGGGEMPNEIWDDADLLTQELDFDNTPPENASYAKINDDLQKAKNFKTWQKELKEYLYRGQPMELWKCAELKKYSEVGETLGEFKIRLEQMVSEKRDEAVEKLRDKYASKFQTLRDKIRRAEARIEREEDEYKAAKMDNMLSWGQTLMGGLFGRRKSFTSTMRSQGRSSKQKSDIGRAEDAFEDLQEKFKDLEVKFKDDVDELEDKLSVDNLEYESLSLPPRKSDISIEQFGVVWLPWRVDSSGIAEPLYEN